MPNSGAIIAQNPPIQMSNNQTGVLQPVPQNIHMEPFNDQSFSEIFFQPFDCNKGRHEIEMKKLEIEEKRLSLESRRQDSLESIQAQLCRTNDILLSKLS